MTRRFLIASGTAASLLTCVLLVACTGSTGGSGEGDDADAGTGFVATAETVGTLSVELLNSEIEVTDTAGFFARVRNSRGEPVPGVRVSCDTELGLALIEPSTGREITDSNGDISGKIGCAAPGSFQMACRLPVGASLRQFVDVRCTGTVQPGFVGFPGAGGGTLGLPSGGVGTIPEDTDDGLLTIRSIIFSDGGEPNTRQIDLDWDNDCNNDGTLTDPESFSDAMISVNIKNDSATTYVFSSYSFVVPNGVSSGTNYVSPQIALTGETFVVDPKNEATFVSVFAHQLNSNYGGSAALITNNKSFVGSTSNINRVNTDVEVTFYGVDPTGRSVEVTGSVNVSFSNFVRC